MTWKYSQDEDSFVTNPAKLALTREEQLTIIASVMSGLGKSHVFERDAVKFRIIECLNIASEVMGESLTDI